MWALVLLEVPDGDAALPVGLVPLDEAPLLKLTQKPRYIGVVVRKHARLEPRRSVLQATVSVGLRP
ncbi:hypothetical protein D7X74_37845 [Corallococcus sp. CA047B]|nr:hypothetical protein D7X74_37845 [Corallococcus sp. CA047B]